MFRSFSYNSSGSSGYRGLTKPFMFHILLNFST